MELRLRRRRVGESLSVLHQDIRRLMALAHPTLQQEAREAIACDYFIDAMDDPDFALKIRERAPPTLDEALKVALRLEAWTKDAIRQRNEEPPRLKPKVRGAANDDTVSFNERFDRLEADFSRRLDKLMKLQESSSAKPEVTGAPTMSIIGASNAAGNSGEMKLQQNRDDAKASWPRKQQGSRRSPAVCWKCGLQGHAA